MFKALIKGDEVRHGKQIYLGALSKTKIEALDDKPLPVEVVYLINEGNQPISHMSAQQVAQSYKTQGELVFALHLQSTDDIIGVCRLSKVAWQARHAELTFAIFEADYITSTILIDVIQTLLQFVYWEANLNRIYSHCVEDNQLWRDAFAQCGFTNEGALRQEVYRDGHYLAKIVYSILQREWSPNSADES